MKGDLLWVYEGLTQYLGFILTARSGLAGQGPWRENLAEIAAYLDQRPGRTWRPLIDTAIAAQLLYNATPEWQSWRRGTDFYNESLLIWLEVDALIRQRTHGQKSIDDFCHAFHGGQSGAPAVVPYTFDDVVATLERVTPYDWRGFLTQRLESTAPHAPLGGVTNSGWKVVYRDTMNNYESQMELATKTIDERFSIGMVVDKDGYIVDVVQGLPAAKAGVGPGMKVIAVNSRQWSKDVFREGIKGTKTDKTPLELLVENGTRYRTFALNYHDGLRYPDLERDATKPDLLSEILRPKAQTAVVVKAR
jgi:predicted metalloprotease with PDZ domain